MDQVFEVTLFQPSLPSAIVLFMVSSAVLLGSGDNKPGREEDTSVVAFSEVGLSVKH